MGAAARRDVAARLVEEAANEPLGTTSRPMRTTDGPTPARPAQKRRWVVARRRRRPGSRLMAPGADPEGHLAAGVASRREAERLIAPRAGSPSMGVSRRSGSRSSPRSRSSRSTAAGSARRRPSSTSSSTSRSGSPPRRATAAGTVVDLIPRALAGAGRLYPVGRLDQDFAGLIRQPRRVGRPRPPSAVRWSSNAVGLATPLNGDLRSPPSGRGSGSMRARRRPRRPTTDDRVEVRSLVEVLDRARGTPPGPAPRSSRAGSASSDGCSRGPGRRSPGSRAGAHRDGPPRLAPGRSGRTAECRRGPLARGRPRRATPMTAWSHGRGIDGPASSGKSSVGAAAARELGYRFWQHGPALPGADRARPEVWHRPERSGRPRPAGRPGELASDGDGRLSRVMVDGVDVTADVRGPAVDRSVSEVGEGPRGPGGPPRASACARGRRRDRHGRSRHRDGRAAGRRSQGVPRRLGRGACPAPSRGARSRTGLTRGGRDPGRPPSARRPRSQPGGRRLPAAARPPGCDRGRLADGGRPGSVRLGDLVRDRAPRLGAGHAPRPRRRGTP